MSRTYKTRPLSVRVHDPKEKDLQPKPIHTCDTGSHECDLPEFDANALYTGGKCYWSFSFNKPKNICGCNMCTQHEEKIAERREFRKKSKNQLRNALKNLVNVNDLENVDELEENISYDEPVVEDKYFPPRSESYTEAETRRKKEAEQDEIFRRKEQEALARKFEGDKELSGNES